MKSRWLVILACLLVVACGKPEDSGSDSGSGGSGTEVKTQPEDSGSDSDGKSDDGSGGESDEGADTKAPADEDTKSFKSSSDGDAGEGDAPALSRADQLDGLMAEFAELNKAMQEDMGKAKRNERQAIFTAFTESVGELGEKFLALTEVDPKDEVAADALNWMMANVRDQKVQAKALALLKEHHMDSEAMGTVASMMVRSMPSQENEDFLVKLRESSPHNSVKGAATMALAQFVSSVKSAKEQGITGDYFENFDVDKYDLEELYQDVVDNYGEATDARGQSLADVAGKALFEIQYLSIGKVAPDIEAEDLDGETFKLSDYRGKVVVLDFWGDW